MVMFGLGHLAYLFGHGLGEIGEGLGLVVLPLFVLFAVLVIWSYVHRIRRQFKRPSDDD